MASVRKRQWTHKGATKEAWLVDYVDMAGNRRSGGTFKLKKDADRRCREIENEIEAGVHISASMTKTVAEAADQFLRWYDQRWKIGEITGETVKRVEGGIKMQVIPAFGQLKLTAVTTEIVQVAIAEWATRYSRKTIERGIMCIRSLLSFAVQKRWLKRNALKDDPPRRPKPHGERVAMPDKDAIRAIIRALDNRRRGCSRLTHRNRVALIFLALFGGMRKGEILGLQWENVDFANDVIRVRHSWSRYDGLKGPKTLAGIRDIPMSRPVRYALLQILDYWQVEEHLAGETRTASRWVRNNAIDRSSGACLDKQSLPTGFVICDRGQKPLRPTSITVNYLHPVLREAGLWPEGQKKAPYTFHSLRHVAVSLMIEKGLPAMQLTEVIGHSNVSTTLDIYGHLFPDDALTRRTVDKIADQFATTASAQQQSLTVSEK